MSEGLGTVRISPSVLRTIVCLTALSVPGVVGMSGDLVSGMKGILSHKVTQKGVKVKVENDEIYIDLYVVVDSNAKMLEAASQIQERVVDAIDKTVGMTVREINVHIEDVR